MAKEIERKFLVADESYRSMAIYKSEIVQGYLSINPDATVRVRINGDKAFITVKSRNVGVVRNEWEYPVDPAEARQMLETCCQSRLIVKTRHIVPAENGLKWEIDELPEPESAFVIPPFIGEEVTGNPRYYNSVLSAI